MAATTGSMAPPFPETYRVWMVAAFMLGAIVRDTLGDPDAADLLARMDRFAPPPGQPSHHFGALSPGEIRVLRYLRTSLSAREVACELFISVNTVKTHQRHLYQKLGVHSRTQAVEQARALGLLAPAARRR